MHVHVVVRRYRKRLLRTLHERECKALNSNVTKAFSARYCALLDAGQVEQVVALRRRALAASAAGSAAVTSTASAEAATSSVGESNVAVAGAHLETALEDGTLGDLVLGDADVDAVEHNGDELGAAASVRSVAGLFASDDSSSSLPSWVTSLSEGLKEDSRQFKILVGNLQINASLIIVFPSIPWPTLHTEFINALSLVKLDIAKVFTWVVPCLHSTHFMSLATWVAAPIILVLIAAAAVAVAATARWVCCLPKRRCKKTPCNHYTLASASTATLKVTIAILLFIYPTICSKVFTTFKCSDVIDGESFMVADMTIRFATRASG